MRPPIDEHAGSPWRWDPLEHRSGAARRDDAVVLTSSAELLDPGEVTAAPTAAAAVAGTGIQVPDHHATASETGQVLVPELDLPQAPSSDRVLSAGIVGARR